MLRHDDAGGPVPLDLRDRVTVFVTTVGAPTFEACLARLAGQDCRFTLRVIERVAPMHAAFQQMLDECATPYYVQVDEDMLLYPHAVRRLYERIEAAGPATALAFAPLYDVHLERSIVGVKIFRHAIVRDYPFSADDSFEIDQVARLEADGHQVWRDPRADDATPAEALGLHGTRWTPAAIFTRYAHLERRRQTRRLRHDWFAPYGAEFLERFRRQPTRQNFFALMGVVAGVLAARQGPGPAKDFRTYDALPGFAALEQFLAAFAPLDAGDDAAETPRERAPAPPAVLRRR